MLLIYYFSIDISHDATHDATQADCIFLSRVCEEAGHRIETTLGTRLEGSDLIHNITLFVTADPGGI